MALQSGSRLGPYQITAPIGAGGMGEVYRGVDTRLGRDVAIKVLPSDFAANEQHRARFEREAKAISSLNHPNICTLFDVGSDNGTEYLVMELVEGESLAERIARGPLPLDLVLKTASEIADALERAHRAGIVHRDLKPGNVILTKSGAKLLDFGLAKSIAVFATSSPTSTTLHVAERPLTAEGTIVGTFQYMAPEQIEGQDVDHRADLFSLGGVIYEMTTGRRAFTATTNVSLIANILGSEPPSMSSVAPLTPPSLERVVRSCLAKYPDDRFQTAHDVKVALQWIREERSSGSATAPGTVSHARRVSAWSGWLVAALVAIAGIAVATWMWRHRLTDERVLSAEISAPPNVQFSLAGDSGGAPVLSRDGRFIAFAATDASGNRSLWVRALDSIDAHQIEGTAGARFPFWSPDGKSIGFFADGKMKTIDVNGGAPLIVADAPDARGGSWSDDNSIVYAPFTRDGIFRIPAGGGTPARLTSLRGNDTTHRWPLALPGGKFALYLAANHNALDSQTTAIRAVSLDGKQDFEVLRTLANVIFASGRLIFLRENTLFAQRFDPVTAKLSGTAETLARNVRFDLSTWRGVFDASSNGLFIYQRGGANGTHLTWFDRTGKSVGTVGDLARYYDVSVSPDGKMAAVTIADPESDLWIIDLTTNTRKRLTFERQAISAPFWSPDGRDVFYSAGKSQTNVTTIYRRPVAGGAPQVVYHDDRGPAGSGLTPDGKFIVLSVGNSRASYVGLAAMSGGEPLRVLAGGQMAAYEGCPSVDGKWIAFTGTEAGREEAYVTSLDGKQKWQISSGGGRLTRWSRDGRHLYYAKPNRTFVEVDFMEKNGEFVVTATRDLFRLNVNLLTDESFDFAPDGRMLVNGEDDSSTPLIVTTNWSSTLKQ